MRRPEEVSGFGRGCGRGFVCNPRQKRKVAEVAALRARATREKESSQMKNISSRADFLPATSATSATSLEESGVCDTQTRNLTRNLNKKPETSRNFTVVDSPEKAMTLMREQAEQEQTRWCIGTHPAGYIVMRHSWAAVHGIRHSVSYTPRIKPEE